MSFIDWVAPFLDCVLSWNRQEHFGFNKSFLVIFTIGFPSLHIRSELFSRDFRQNHNAQFALQLQNMRL